MTSNKSLIRYFLITFGISWLLWLPAVLRSQGIADLPPIVGLIGNFALLGPFISAFLLTRRIDGRDGVRALWRRGWSLKFDKRWLLPTLLFFPLQAAITVVLMLVLNMQIDWSYSLALAAVPGNLLYIYFLNALPEEYGWRGFAIGRLQETYSALTASLLLGAIWACWHLPLFFITGTAQAAIPFYQFLLQQMVFAVFYTWLFNNTNGSVLVAIIFHTMGNITGALIPTWTSNGGRWTGFLVQLLIVAAVLAYWGPNHLHRHTAGTD